MMENVHTPGAGVLHSNFPHPSLQSSSVIEHAGPSWLHATAHTCKSNSEIFGCPPLYTHATEHQLRSNWHDYATYPSSPLLQVSHEIVGDQVSLTDLPKEAHKDKAQTRAISQTTR